MVRRTLLIFCALFITGCFSGKFKSDKSSVLAFYSILSNPSDDSFGFGFQVSNNEIQLWRYCSDSMTRDKTPVVLSNELKLVVRKDGTVICDNTDTATLRQMIDAGMLDLTVLCEGTFDGDVTLNLTNELGHSLIEGRNVVYADNTKGLVPDPTLYENCDTRASPLFVDLRTDNKSFELTAPENGVLFDILGLNSTPYPHAKKRISWFKDSAMAMLVLPNANGEVNGINELFGDNTLGPDGKFAENGFLALAKYDDGDNVIDRKDPVYKQLSLWVDRDLNGIAGPGELMSLSYLGIEALDLEYDHNFSEIDRYGNEVKYKSVVRFRNGELRLMYDLWFVIR